MASDGAGRLAAAPQRARLAARLSAAVVTAPALLWGAGVGAVVFLLLLAGGWRTERVWYPVVFGMAVLTAAMIGVVIVTIGSLITG